MEKANKLLGALANLVVVGGIFLFFLQDAIEKKRDRITQSVEYGRSLHAGDYAEARTALITPWIDRRSLLEIMYDPDEPSPTNDDLRNLLMSALNGSNPAERKSIITALYRIEGLFLALRGCIEANVCDAEAARDIIGKDATELACFYGPGFEHIENTTGLIYFGEGIWHFADQSVCNPPGNLASSNGWRSAKC